MPPGQPSPRRLPTLRIALVVLVLVGLIGAALVADGLRLKVGPSGRLGHNGAKDSVPLRRNPGFAPPHGGR